MWGAVQRLARNDLEILRMKRTVALDAHLEPTDAYQTNNHVVRKKKRRLRGQRAWWQHGTTLVSLVGLLSFLVHRAPELLTREGLTAMTTAVKAWCMRVGTEAKTCFELLLGAPLWAKLAMCITMFFCAVVFCWCKQKVKSEGEQHGS